MTYEDVTPFAPFFGLPPFCGVNLLPKFSSNREINVLKIGFYLLLFFAALNVATDATWFPIRRHFSVPRLLGINQLQGFPLSPSNSARTTPASCFAVGNFPFNSPGSFDCN